MASIQDRVVGALRLDVATYEEVEHDQQATGQAALIVLIAGVSAGLATGTATGIVGLLVAGFVGWGLSSWILLMVGTKLLPGRNTEADLGQLLRATGFAQSPRLFAIIGIVPLLGWLVSLAILVWTLVAMVIAIRQALDYDDTLRAVIVGGIAWVIHVVIYMILAVFVGGAAALGGALG